MSTLAKMSNSAESIEIGLSATDFSCSTTFGEGFGFSVCFGAGFGLGAGFGAGFARCIRSDDKKYNTFRFFFYLFFFRVTI
jgi:hypothetical protein